MQTQIELLEWKKFDRAIELGYLHAIQIIEHLRDALMTEPALIKV